MAAVHAVQALYLAVRLRHQYLLDMAAVHESHHQAAPAGTMGRVRTDRTSPEAAELSCAHVSWQYILSSVGADAVSAGTMGGAWPPEVASDALLPL